MKKIMLVFDGTHFSEGAFEFARKINDIKPVLLTGAFLPQAQLSHLWSYADASGNPLFFSMLDENEDELLQQNVGKFEKLCRDNGIEYRVHKDCYDFVLTELKTESRYADLIILGSEIFYKDMGTDEPNEYLRHALQDMKCPVLLVPEKFDFPESIILAYDGSDNSVFAIKQFSYLFPELAGKKTLLVYANDNPEKDFPDKIQIEELAARHFSDLTMFKLDINPKKYFSTWLSEKNSALLVCGAYGRSGLSALFRKSFVRNVIADHKVPVFIVHK